MQNFRNPPEEKKETEKRSSASQETAKARQQDKEAEPVEVTELKNRVAELEKLVSKMVPPKANGKRK